MEDIDKDGNKIKMTLGPIKNSMLLYNYEEGIFLNPQFVAIRKTVAAKTA